MENPRGGPWKLCYVDLDPDHTVTSTKGEIGELKPPNLRVWRDWMHRIVRYDQGKLERLALGIARGLLED